MTQTTTISADRARAARKYSTFACSAMDAALNAARYTSYSNALGNFDPRRASRLRREFDQYKRSVLRKKRVPSDVALLDSTARLIDSGDIDGVYHATEKWLCDW